MRASVLRRGVRWTHAAVKPQARLLHCSPVLHGAAMAPAVDDSELLQQTMALLRTVGAGEPLAGAGGDSAGTAPGAAGGAAAATAAGLETAATAPAINGAKPDDLACLKPREIVKELDEYIIGQADAKKAISVALRNRWRRLHLPEELQAEIIPKNILMVGPTGVGKTEIARRLAKLARAPFVKVEATKFTEVGFHGRDVDTIIRDLLEASLQLCRQLKTEQFRDDIKPVVERRILEAMTGPEAREDTIASFRRLLQAGEMDDREIHIDIPIKSNSVPDVEMSVQGASIDFAELMSRMGGGKMKTRMEKKKLKVKECWPILMDYELDKKLSTVDIRKEAVELAEQNGIVFIDEIDKIVSQTHKYSGDASSEGVQRDLLPLIEGCTVDVKRFGPVKTDYMLFVASGAFHETKPSDMLAELQGRLPIRVELSALTVDDLRRILTEPKANLIRQQKALIGAEDVNVEFDEESISEIADMAAKINSTVENIGARRLHTVIERIMEDISFEAPDMAEGSVVTIDAELVRQKVGDLFTKQDLHRFIL